MKTLLTILGCGATLFSYAQTVERLSVEFPTPSFTLAKEEIKKQIPIESTIDLRDLLDTPIPSLSVLATSKESNTFEVLDEGNISKYKLCNDSLWLYEKETPLTKLVYSQPELKVAFPLQEGKHITGSASGKGYYADKLSFKFHTAYESFVYPSNDIIMPDGTKLDNIYRVNTIRTTFYSNLASDSIENTIKEEENFWYIQGDLFPILSSYKTSVNADYCKSCYYVRKPQNEDFENKVSDKEHDTKSGKDSQTLYSPLEYKSTNHEDTHEIEIAYTTKTNTNITFITASIGGVIYHTKYYTTKSNEEYTYCYNYSHLPCGEYAIRIQVNNQQFSIKFNVK